MVWFPLIKQIIQEYCPQNKPLYLALDRTQWKDQNLFMVAVIHQKRALPVYWQFLPKKGASNLMEQKAILKPVLKLLKSDQLIVLGDREFHVEGSSASIKRLTNLVLLIAIAYTISTLKGQSLIRKGQKEYISRLRKVKQVMTKNSKFLLGLYGQVWIITQRLVLDWVEKLMRLNRNKLPFYQRGLKAMELIQQGL